MTTLNFNILSSAQQATVFHLYRTRNNGSQFVESSQRVPLLVTHWICRDWENKVSTHYFLTAAGCDAFERYLNTTSETSYQRAVEQPKVAPTLEYINQIVSYRGDSQCAAHILEGNLHTLYILASDVSKLYAEIEQLKTDLKSARAAYNRVVYDRTLELARHQEDAPDSRFILAGDKPSELEVSFPGGGLRITVPDTVEADYSAEIIIHCNDGLEIKHSLVTQIGIIERITPIEKGE